MAREFGRPQRVADFLRKELSVLIQREVRDPRLTMVSVTDVEVSRDLSHAKIYVTIMGYDDKKTSEEPLKALNGAAGFLRSMIAKQSSMRTTPSLHFHFDQSVTHGSYMSSLIDSAVKEDDQNSASAADDTDSQQDETDS